MRLRLLGPVRLCVGERELLGSCRPAQRALVALLGLRANQVVSRSDLADRLWGPAQPATADEMIKAYLSRLRTTLRRAGAVGVAERLVTGDGGYRLAVGPDELDLLEYERLTARAERLLSGGHPAGAAAALRHALDLWDGPALAGLSLSPGATAEAALLDERRTAALALRIEADLLSGRPFPAIDDLRALLAEHPLRERSWAGLMVALCRTGQPAAALAAYDEARSRIVAELGLEPGADLQRLHRAVLAGTAPDELPFPRGGAATRATTGATTEVTAEAPPAPTDDQGGPAELPINPASFTGRQRERERLRAFLDEPPAGATPVVAISGVAGVGKSALAVHFAHAVAGRFPDGQLYTDLAGATAGVTPRQPLDVLHRFLRGLGATGGDLPAGAEPADAEPADAEPADAEPADTEPADAEPADTEEAAARFRSATARRRLLVLLDNAESFAQVRPLLPASPGCLVLITARSAFAGLDGALHLRLDVLPEGEAIGLLARAVGAERVAAERAAAAAVARLCGYLPLALRIAAARLVDRPDRPIRELAGRLADERHRLDELTTPDLAVRAAFGMSYRATPAAAAFRLLGLLPGADFAAPAVAALLDADGRAAESTLDSLCDARLVDAGGGGRYRLHDLLRLYARERVERDEPEKEREAALDRALTYYLDTAAAADPLLRPGQPGQPGRPGGPADGGGFGSLDAALAWLDAERANLLATVALLESAPVAVPEAFDRAVPTLFAFLDLRGDSRDLERVARGLLAIARRCGNPLWEAFAHRALGSIARQRCRYEEADEHLAQALEGYRAAGDRDGEIRSLSALGVAANAQGRRARSIEYLTRSRAIAVEIGDPRGVITAANNLAITYREQGSYAEAIACLDEALALARQIGAPSSQTRALNNLGDIYLETGDYERALHHHRASLALCTRYGQRLTAAEDLQAIGEVHLRRGEPGRAAGHLRQSLAVRRELDDRRGMAVCLWRLGVAVAAQGDRAAATAHWREAGALFTALGPSGQASPEAGAVRDLLGAVSK